MNFAFLTKVKMNFSTIGKVCKVSKIFKILIVGALGCLLFDTVDELCILIKIRNDFQHYVKVLVKIAKFQKYSRYN